METDLAILGIEIQATGLDEALDGLDRLYAKSRDTEKKLKSVQAPVPGLTRPKTTAPKDGKEAGSELDALSVAGADLARNLNRALGTAFDRFVIQGREAGSVLKSLEKDLLRLGGRYLNGSGSGGGANLLSSVTSVAGDLLTNLLPGFSGGGQFTVGGAAGRDRNLVGLRLTRGERVTVETAAQQKQGASVAGNQNVSLSFQISTPDAESFRRSQTQIQGEALRSAQRILKRNG